MDLSIFYEFFNPRRIYGWKRPPTYIHFYGIQLAYFIMLKHAVHWCAVLQKIVCSASSLVSDSASSNACTLSLVVKPPKKKYSRHSASGVRLGLYGFLHYQREIGMVIVPIWSRMPQN